MKVKFNRFIPFPGYFAINLFGVCVVRKEYEHYFSDNATQSQKNFVKKTYNHEGTHTEQMKELGYVFFYILYFIEWLVKLVASIFTKKNAYRSVSFEQEAYINETNDEYNSTRHHYAWLKYIFKMA